MTLHPKDTRSQGQERVSKGHVSHIRLINTIDLLPYLDTVTNQTNHDRNRGLKQRTKGNRWVVWALA